MKIQILLFLSVLLLSSCTTYQIPVDSFKEQFQDRDPAKLNRVVTKTSFGEFEYLANTMDTIYCLDKNNNVKKLKKKPSLEMKIILKDGKKSYFYADQVIIRDGIVCGERSMFLNLSKCISIDEIEKIEIQDGHKYFNYK